jgi:hypothetical protein
MKNRLQTPNHNGRLQSPVNNHVGNTDDLPSAFRPSSEMYRVVRKELKPISLDRSIILVAAQSNSGEQAIASYVAHIFFSDEVRAVKSSVLRNTIAHIQQNIVSVERHEAERKRALHVTRRDRDEPGGPMNWRLSTRLMVIVMFIFACLYLAAEVRNGMLFAKMSGIQELKGNLAALLLSLVPCTALGVFLKLLSLLFHTDRSRWLYHCVVGTCGLVAALAAIPFFASTYGAFMRDPVESMLSASAPTFSPGFTIGVQILLCGLATAALVIFAFAIIEHHRKPLKVDNAAWLKIQADLQKINRTLRHDRDLLGFAQGKLDALNNELNEMTSKATLAYRAVRRSYETLDQQSKEGADAFNRMFPISQNKK